MLKKKYQQSAYYLFGNGGSRNHGCEAISRGTCRIFENRETIVLSGAAEEDRKYGLDSVCSVIGKEFAKNDYLSMRFWKAYWALKVKGDYKPLDELPYLNLLTQPGKQDIALSVGGDNYCYTPEGSAAYGRFRKFLHRRGVKTVLWGCSVEKKLIDEKVEKDLGAYDLIVARESITYETLKKINPNTMLAPDPAFMLEKQTGIYPHGLGSRAYIGVNVSPLIQRLDQGGSITMENYRALVAHILETTDRDVALIPHVVWDYNDDRIPLGQLYEEFRHTGRVYQVEDQNCMQLKDIISGCEFFVGARTHATIAAYSTCVPTLVVGYSVKARGIARDLFGSEQDYVLPVQELRKQDDLVCAFQKLYGQKNAIRTHLTQMMPDYIAGIGAAKEAVERL